VVYEVPDDVDKRIKAWVLEAIDPSLSRGVPTYRYDEELCKLCERALRVLVPKVTEVLKSLSYETEDVVQSPRAFILVEIAHFVRRRDVWEARCGYYSAICIPQVPDEVAMGMCHVSTLFDTAVQCALNMKYVADKHPDPRIREFARRYLVVLSKIISDLLSARTPDHIM